MGIEGDVVSCLYEIVLAKAYNRKKIQQLEILQEKRNKYTNNKQPREEINNSGWMTTDK